MTPAFSLSPYCGNHVAHLAVDRAAGRDGHPVPTHRVGGPGREGVSCLRVGEPTDAFRVRRISVPGKWSPDALGGRALPGLAFFLNRLPRRRLRRWLLGAGRQTHHQGGGGQRAGPTGQGFLIAPIASMERRAAGSIAGRPPSVPIIARVGNASNCWSTCLSVPIPMDFRRPP